MSDVESTDVEADVVRLVGVGSDPEDGCVHGLGGIKVTV